MLAGIGLAVAEDLWLTSMLVTLAVIVLLELAPVSDAIYRIGIRRHGDPNRPRRARALDTESSDSGQHEQAAGDPRDR